MLLREAPDGGRVPLPGAGARVGGDGDVHTARPGRTHRGHALDQHAQPVDCGRLDHRSGLCGDVVALFTLDFHLGDHGPHRNRLALLGQYLRHRSGRRRGHLHAHFVGDDLDQWIVLLDPVARRNEPPAYDPFGDGLAYVWQLYLHVVFPITRQ